jgi:hypothetical protein
MERAPHILIATIDFNSLFGVFTSLLLKFNFLIAALENLSTLRLG